MFGFGVAGIVGAARKKGQSLAFGLRRNLDEFAESVNSKTYVHRKQSLKRGNKPTNTTVSATESSMRQTPRL